MKNNKIIFIFSVLALIFQSCKNDAKKTDIVEEQVELKETFDVSFNLNISKDDTFQLYYTEDNSLNFGDDRSVKSIIKGNEQNQDILFKLPADVLPTQIRLDFGNNNEQGDIVINSMKLKYLDNDFSVSFGSGKESVTHYFYLLDQQIKYDDTNSTIKLLKPKDQIYDPLMWSNQLLSDEMVKLYKN